MRRERFEWSDEEVHFIAQVCIILYILIVEMRRSGELDTEAGGEDVELSVNLVEEFCAPPPAAAVAAGAPAVEGQADVRDLQALLGRVNAVTSEAAHMSLKDAVTDHL